MDGRTLEQLRWLLDEGRLLSGPGLLLAGLCSRLSAAGLRLLRANVQVRTLHPEVTVTLYIWHRPDSHAFSGSSNSFLVVQQPDPLGPVEVTEAASGHGAFESDTFKQSPFRVVAERGEIVHERISKTQENFAFPILKDMQGIGATDYLALPLTFSSGVVSALSLVTDVADGFSLEDVELLKDLSPALSMCFELHSANHVRRSLLRTYLGADPGELVQAGHVRPGDVQKIEAAIAFSDIRGFTDLSARTESRELVNTLNGYFGAVTEPLERHGGQILKFIGDALLVVFPVSGERGRSDACSAALRAALEADVCLDAWNAEREKQGLKPLNHGFGLHVGTAEYGNIGSRSRLDFTVIGRDVNKASRVEGMCGKLGRRLVVSKEFVEQLPGEHFESLGEHSLKGVSGLHELFGVANSS